MNDLLKDIRACTLCQGLLPLEPRPILNFHPESRILLASQAPGIRAHDSQLPWNDPSGDRLRAWLGVDRKTFYDPHNFAIVPMGFCYPGKGRSGDLPPRPECSRKWLEKILRSMPKLELKIVIGTYAQAYHFQSSGRLTETVRGWKLGEGGLILLPHPSPRNNIWLAKNPWFEAEIVPQLREKVRDILGGCPVLPKGNEESSTRLEDSPNLFLSSENRGPM